jgi:hypothetical protein
MQRARINRPQSGTLAVTFRRRDIALLANATEYVPTRIGLRCGLRQSDGAGATRSQITSPLSQATLATTRCMRQPTHAPRGSMIWET